MAENAFQLLVRRLRGLFIGLAALLGIGAAGYRWISAGASSWLDCLYMTVITLTTIGYGEVVDLSDHPGGRVFTMALAFSGIGLLTYLLTSLTSLAVEGPWRAYWRKRKMDARLATLEHHYLICGNGLTAARIADELAATGRPFVRLPGDLPEPPVESAAACVLGDFTDDAPLERAGIRRAAGLFAATEDDQANIVLCLTARALHPALRIVAAAQDDRRAEKLRKAGADAVVSAVRIGALRMASEMVRPAVVSFLDTMLRAPDAGLRVEEIPVGAAAGKKLGDFDWTRLGNAVLLARRQASNWTFNPPPETTLCAGDRLIFMAAPAARAALENALAGTGRT